MAFYVKYRRYDEFEFTNRFPTEEKARSYVFDLCEKLEFGRYIAIKASEDGGVYNLKANGDWMEAKYLGEQHVYPNKQEVLFDE